MKRAFLMAATAAVGLTAMIAFAADAPPPKPDAQAGLYSGKFFKADESVTNGAVNGIN